ncbi:alpha/beta hydrolase [Amycolatopsis acidicola]|uniref:Alpha/beta hydrolase n=1 Tax=Amycolatopsis acidicola TaxID=2596893 RepID=A0A5N0V3E4_9PSEU|nr:alpha/beta hydrolase [Amycolatopsis acidicola]KAA9160505.1 alpha/beta hydrolase [Amycolatopsis acidicola]
MSTLTTPAEISFDSGGVRLVADRWEPAGERRGTVLLLHGGGQRRHSWHTTGHRLAGQGWTTIAPDARGHGDSDRSPDGDYSADVLIRDLSVIVGQIGEPCVLVGASMGGMTALVGQGEQGDLASALVLVDIVPRVDPAGVRRIMDFMSSAPDGFASLEDVVEAIRAYNPHRKRPPTPDGVRRNVRQAENGRWFWHWDPALLRRGDEPRRDADEDRAKAAARKIDVPTLLVHGTESDIVTAAGIEEFTRLIPGAEHFAVTGAGHMVAGDDNDVFTGRVGEFLGRLPARAG